MSDGFHKYTRYLHGSARCILCSGRLFPRESLVEMCVYRLGQICDAVSAFSLDITTKPGLQLSGCLIAPPSNPFAVAATKRKGAWLLAANSCIWGHWRAALDAIHDITSADSWYIDAALGQCGFNLQEQRDRKPRLLPRARCRRAERHRFLRRI